MFGIAKESRKRRRGVEEDLLQCAGGVCVRGGAYIIHVSGRAFGKS